METTGAPGNSLKEAMESGLIPLPYHLRPLNPPSPQVYEEDRGTLIYHPAEDPAEDFTQS